MDLSPSYIFNGIVPCVLSAIVPFELSAIVRLGLIVGFPILALGRVN